MNSIDAAIALLVGIFALLGLRRGFVAQVVGIAALAGGLALATRAAPWVAARAPAFARWVRLPGPPFDRYAAWIAVFGLASVVALGLGAWLRERVRRSPLAPADRVFGAMVGGAKGVLLCYVLLYLALCHPSRPLDAEMRDSIAAPFLLRAVGRTSLLFPRDFVARGEECVRDAEIARAGREKADPVPCAVPPRTEEKPRSPSPDPR